MINAFQVYVGKVQVPRHRLTSFLRSAQILSIKGLTHIQTKTKKKSFCDNSPAENPIVGYENNDSQETNDEESTLKRLLNSSSDLGSSKRPRLIPRPPPKPVTTTITPGKMLITIFRTILQIVFVTCSLSQNWHVMIIYRLKIALKFLWLDKLNQR